MSARNPWKFVPLAVAAVVLAVVATTGLLESAAGPETAVATAAAPGKAFQTHTGRRSPGKPRPPVEVSLLPGSELEAGVPARLALQIRSAERIQVTDLAVEGDEGLAVVSARREVPGIGGTGYQSDGEGVRFEIAAVPMSGGTRQLSGLLRFTVNGVEQAAPFRLAVEVGGPVAVPVLRLRKPDREPVLDANGELLDSMPAETTVR